MFFLFLLLPLSTLVARRRWRLESARPRKILPTSRSGGSFLVLFVAAPRLQVAGLGGARGSPVRSPKKVFTGSSSSLLLGRVLFETRLRVPASRGVERLQRVPFSGSS